MLLGKRPRPPMRRTTSLTEFSADVGAALEAAMPQPPAILQEQDAAAVAAIAASAQQYYWPPGAVPMEGVTVPPPMPVPVPVVAPAVDHLQPPGAAATAVSHQHQQQLHQHQMPLPLINPQQNLMDVRYYGSGTAAPMVSPRRHRRNSADFQLDTAHFLKACGLCNRRLKPGKDIYMYRGEIAFCSSECRQQQMNFDERKDKKCSLTSIKKDHPQAASAASATASTNSEPSATNGVAAA